MSRVAVGAERVKLTTPHMKGFQRLSSILIVSIALAHSLRADDDEMSAAKVLPSGPVGAFWTASWIGHPTASPTDYGVFCFRKRFTLAAKPETFVVHVSGDNRYRLYVNGTSVCVGPARGDQLHWRYETVDLAPQLRAGENVLAAEVWNFGELRPVAQASVKTAFLLQGHGAAEKIVNTDASWRVLRDEAIAPRPVDYAKLNTYIVVGPGDDVDGARYPWGWTEAEFDDRAWASPRVYARGAPHGFGSDVKWWLVSRTIPLPEESVQRIPQLRRTEGVAANAGFLSGGEPLVVPAHTKVVLLLDQIFETTAYPQVVVSGGQGSTVTLTYAEALVDKNHAKGNRNDIDGRTAIGLSDRFRPDGGARRLFSTRWWRTYRYIEVAIETAGAPLTVHDLHGVFTAYPFRARGAFASDDPALTDLWNVGWRTARLCAYETYMDCPYYEQLQYVGDTRIQALVSLYVAGDDRLMRNAIELFDDSRIPEGLTQSRYPNCEPQVIPPFSLCWIEMVHDYWMHRDDSAFVQDRFGGISAVLGWFEHRIDPQSGLLGPLPYWNFVDWTDQWPWTEARFLGGDPSGTVDGGSAIVTLQLVIALDKTAEMLTAFGRATEAQHDRELAQKLRAAVIARCWDPAHRMFADTPGKTSFSQHANTLAVLADAVPPAEARELIARVESDRSLIQATQYFRFYLARAMKRAGLGDRYVSLLQPWRDMLARGLTTFAEKPDPTRSDCHAWSASPNYELLATVCGIEPDAPGFKSVRIEPHLGTLTRLDGTVPHPLGPIIVHLECHGDKLSGTVTLPAGLTGRFVWRGREITLRAGTQPVAF